jgi:hypothetical protein
MDCLSLFSRVKSSYSWDLDLKKDQEDILNLLIVKQNVMVVLPTGYGKSLLFILTPLLLDEVCLIDSSSPPQSRPSPSQNPARGSGGAL